MSMNNLFCNRDMLESIAQKYPTPFYLYDEAGIETTACQVMEAFSWDKNHRQFFAVKATPTPEILKILQRMGHGVVCSSAVELRVAKAAGFAPGEILFSPNFPNRQDIEMAAEMGVSVVLDGDYLTDDFAQYGLLKGTVGMRFNPGGEYYVNKNKVSAPGTTKFGFTRQQLLETGKKLKESGVSSFGLFGYMGGNIMETDYYKGLTRLLAETGRWVAEESGLELGYVNISGGVGIAYHPNETMPDVFAMASDVKAVMDEVFGAGERPAVYTELSRYVTGPHGLLVSRVIHEKSGYRQFVGLDASAHNLMRPMMYGAYHHISIVGKENEPCDHVYDVVGSVPEGIDRFAQNRPLPETHKGDLAVIHDCGAHGHSMGYNYGGKLRSAELLLTKDGSVRLIRRAETAEDYMATMV
ncbi:MAG: diaminopimelate decarboxylase [Ruminococcaceae bacterium]|nr:diaminopimelate decarboxylase [Oscillospiraceae bacterium]